MADTAARSGRRDEAIRRIRERADIEIADVLLNQRVIAGIGNIYKSEVLFECGIDPFKRVGALDDENLKKIVKKARAMLKRSTRERPRFLVYERAGQPCRKCGTRIESRKQGPDARTTYWCPKCQR